MFRIKVYKQGKETLVAAADADVVGKTFREGKLRLEVKETFYGKEEGGLETLVSQLRLCTIANLVGENAVAVAVAHGFIDPARVIRIEGVPHAQLAVL